MAVKPLDFHECVHDTPVFRLAAGRAEAEVGALEARLNTVVRCCETMMDRGLAYGTAVNGFQKALRDLGADDAYAADKMVADSLARFADAIGELENFRALLLEQARTAVVDSLRQFVKSDVKRVKDSCAMFHKVLDVRVSKVTCTGVGLAHPGAVPCVASDESPARQCAVQLCGHGQVQGPRVQ
jgi:hypothetical protein